MSTNINAMTLDKLLDFAKTQGSTMGKSGALFWEVCIEYFLACLAGLVGKSAAREVYTAYLTARIANSPDLSKADREKMEADKAITSQVSKLGVFADVATVADVQPDYLSETRAQVSMVIAQHPFSLEGVKVFEGLLKVVRAQRDKKKAGPNDLLTDDEVLAILTPTETTKEEGKEWAKVIKAAEKIGKSFNTPVEELKAIVSTMEMRRAKITLAEMARQKADLEASIAASLKANPPATFVEKVKKAKEEKLTIRKIESEM